MTKKIYFDNKCPNCSTDLEYGIIEPEDEIIKQHVECKMCAFEFEIFTVPVWYLRNWIVSEAKYEIEKLAYVYFIIEELMSKIERNYIGRE